MTTPAPLQTEPTPPVPKLSPGAPVGMTVEELERYGRHVNLQRGWQRARALDNADVPPAAGPRDLAGLSYAMTNAQNQDAFYFSHPDWLALRDIRQQVDGVLQSLNERAEITPQAAIQAAKITTLAASLIARHATKVGAHLDTRDQRTTPGGRAMRELTRAAEEHAARASGLDSAQALDTPRLLIAHVHQLTKELRRAEVSQERTPVPGLDDPNDPNLDSALSAGAAADPELAEASQLMTALSELGGRARRAGQRLTLDVRLHGMVETAQLRGFEMISGIAAAAMRRYDRQDRGTDGRRNIAAMIFHYAEQRLERMRGTLGADEERDFGHYETGPPDRYLATLFNESHSAVRELRAQNITPQERTDVQIRFLLVQMKIGAVAGLDGGQEHGTQPRFPPLMYVAGMQTDSPVQTRLTLIDALRRRVESNPFHRDAQFLNNVKDRFTLELAGPPELTAQALQADLNADQVRSAALYLVTHHKDDWVTSPLKLSEAAELNLTYSQAERALAVLQTLDVVGPPNGLTPRRVLTVSPNELPIQLEGLEQRLPNLLELRKSAAAVSASTTPTSAETATQRAAARVAEPPAAAEPRPEQAAAATVQPAPAESAQATTASELPRRNRSAERRHPGNLGPRPAPAESADSGLAKLLEGQEDRLKAVSQSIIASKEDRAAHPGPEETASVKPEHTDEAQNNAQQAQQTAGVSAR